MRGKIFKLLRSNVTRWVVKFVPQKKGLVFLTLHHLDKSEFEWVCQVLDYLQGFCDFLDPKEIEHPEYTLRESSRTQIILTFDDGFRCHKKIVDQCLDSRNIKAIFFIPTAFVGLTGEKAFEFTKRNFFPNSSPKKLEKDSYDAMNWDDLDSLVKSGHIIGAHTRSHPMLSRIFETQLNSEISEAADFLEEKLNIKVSHFAYPFGSIESVDALAFAEAKKRFAWAYSNIRGMGKDSPCRHFIYRQNIVPKSPIWLVEAIVKGRLDFRYKNVRFRASKKIFG